MSVPAAARPSTRWTSSRRRSSSPATSPSEQAKVDDLTAAAEEASRAVEEYVEENTVEDGLLTEAMDDDKISKALATERLKMPGTKDLTQTKSTALDHLIKLYNAEAVAKKAVKEAQAALNLATLKQYGKLTEGEVKTLVLDDKWQATIIGRIASEVESLTFALVARLKELGDRYSETVGSLDQSLASIEAKVAEPPRRDGSCSDELHASKPMPSDW